MDVTVIPGYRELRNKQLIITCQFPLPGVEVGAVLSDGDSCSWRIAYVEASPSGSGVTVYLDPVVPPTPFYLSGMPPTLDVG